ncbi:hypothetical protein EXU57_21630 [Segetibacter sp. 3557_3]|uniref:hypothetical protein n=1 Tax=Segetibacter sp. 3557_3 TaxID=2547429 RepID=UPI001058C987|nr:hypothetical protein [Segetibacter sp. 3557_3]TDH20037.1 hypothetical protein EXU57_21630 [Segetibacter sp. 3557_3]
MKRLNPLPLLFLIMLSCNISGSPEKDYEASKERVKKNERENALRFIKVIASNKRNLLGKTVVRTSISNAASVTSYNDVRLKFLFFRQGQVVENHEEVVGKTLGPNSTIDFTVRYTTPKGTDSVSVSVMDAKLER